MAAENEGKRECREMAPAAVDLIEREVEEGEAAVRASVAAQAEGRVCGGGRDWAEGVVGSGRQRVRRSSRPPERKGAARAELEAARGRETEPRTERGTGDGGGQCCRGGRERMGGKGRRGCDKKDKVNPMCGTHGW